MEHTIDGAEKQTPLYHIGFRHYKKFIRNAILRALQTREIWTLEQQATVRERWRSLFFENRSTNPCHGNHNWKTTSFIHEGRPTPVLLQEKARVGQAYHLRVRKTIRMSVAGKVTDHNNPSQTGTKMCI